MKKILGLIILFALMTGSVLAKDISLPTPQKEGGMPLMQALNERQTNRVFDANQKLSPQMLSNMLWAGFGVTRPDGKRTAPTARNAQDILIYVALPEGVYLYDAPANKLVQVSDKDIRALTGSQTKMLADAAAVLIYVSDFDKLFSNEERDSFYAALHTGSVYQNIYLFAASEGLNTVVIGMANYALLPELLKLPDNQKVQLVQAIGYKPA